MAVAVVVGGHLSCGGRIEEEVRIYGLAAAPAHENAPKQKHARHAQRAQALDLAETHGKVVRWRPQAPRDRGEGQDVGGQVGQAVPRVGDHGLGIESVAADAFGNCHAKIAVQTESRDAHASIVLVL